MPNRSRILYVAHTLYKVLGIFTFLLLTFIISLKVTDLSEPVNNFKESKAASAPGTITKKVLVLNFDPLFDGSTPLHVYKTWKDPVALQNQYIADVKEASHNTVNYQIIDTKVINDYPTKTSGQKFTNSQYLSCLTTYSAFCNEMTDYLKIINDYNVCGQVNSGTIDELWLFGGPYFGYFEAAMAGPGAFNINGGPINGTTCNRKLSIMGFNYERTNVEMIHNLGHRAESVLTKVFGGYYPYNNVVSLENTWGRYWVYNSILAGKASCGDVHHSPNSIPGAMFTNQNTVPSVCEDWTNYPSTTGSPSNTNCTAWNCTGGTPAPTSIVTGNYFEKYWLSHMPNKTGTTNNKLNNWWAYVMDYDTAIQTVNNGEKWYTVSSAANDTNTSCGTTTSTGLEIGIGTNPSCSSNNQYIAKFTFGDIQIPKNASVSNAYLEFVSDNQYTNPLTETIVITDGTTNSGGITWSITDAWSPQTVVKSSSVTNAVQQILNSSSWSSGKSLTVSLTHSSGSGFRKITGFDKEPMAAARIIINYTPGTNVTPSFTDVPSTHKYFNSIEVLYRNGYTAGCGTNPPKYCPEDVMNRGAAAVFMIRGVFGSSYVPAAPTHIFKDDWTQISWAESWAEAMYKNGLTGGCSTSPLKYCPLNTLNRADVSIFGMRLRYGSSYVPPQATHIFGDNWSGIAYAESWAEQAYKDGIMPACGTINGKPSFCPTNKVTRGEGADVVVKAKNLKLP